MNSPFLKLNRRDFINGLIVAVGSVVFTSCAQWINAPGFDFATFDYSMVVKVAIAAGFGYINKNLFSDGNGNILGYRI